MHPDDEDAALEGPPTDNYYEITVVLQGYIWADSPMRALEWADVLAKNWEEHARFVGAELTESPETEWEMETD